MFDNYEEKDLFWKVINELTFRPAIKISELYESMAEQIENRPRYDVYGKLLLNSDEKSNAYKRIKRLLPLFINYENNVQTVDNQMLMPKLYDPILFDRQLHLYNWMAKKYNGELIETVLPPSLIKEAAYMDNAMPNLGEIIKYFPYYSEKKEKELNFLEYILLLNIAEVTQYRTQGLLKKLLEDPKDKDRVEKWITSVNENLSKPKMYLTYVDTFFGIYRYIAANEYSRASLEAHKHGNADSSDFLSYHLWQQANNAVSTFATITDDILLLAWDTLEKEYRSSKKDLKSEAPAKAASEDMQIRANTYVEIAKTYIDQSIKEIKKILPKLFFYKQKAK